MTLNQASSVLRLSATVDPADPLTQGFYELGGGSSQKSFNDANQCYSLKFSGMDGTSQIDFQSGIFSPYSGTVLEGGLGKDPDGEVIDLDEIYGILFRNTGLSQLQLDVFTWAGSDCPVECVSIAAGAEFLFVFPDGIALSEGLMDLSTSVNGGAGEVVVIGKTSV